MESCEADSTYFFYTIEEGAIEKCGELSASHSSLYINNHKNLIQYSGHMSHYIITEISMDGSKLITKEIDNDTNKPYAKQKNGELRLLIQKQEKKKL